MSKKKHHNEHKLTKEITLRSESDVWYSAKLEWELDRIWIADEPGKCICGHSPIRQICHIKNK